MHTRFLLVLAVSAAVACGSPAPAADTANKFVGKWTYEPGSTVLVDCPGAPQQTLDLSKVPPANQPGYFSLAESSGDSVHEVDARGCQYDWTVSGDAATAPGGQSCATFPDGRGGNRTVHLQSGTKATTGDGSMTVDVHFTSDAPESCSIHVQGRAQKS